MWLDECFEADNKTIDKFYDQLKLPVLIINITKYTILVIGSLLLVTTTIIIILKFKSRNSFNSARHRERHEQQDASQNWISNETTPLLLN